MDVEFYVSGAGASTVYVWPKDGYAVLGWDLTGETMTAIRGERDPWARDQGPDYAEWIATINRAWDATRAKPTGRAGASGPAGGTIPFRDVDDARGFASEMVLFLIGFDPALKDAPLVPVRTVLAIEVPLRERLRGIM